MGSLDLHNITLIISVLLNLIQVVWMLGLHPETVDVLWPHQRIGREPAFG